MSDKHKHHPGPFRFHESLDGRGFEIRTIETDILVATIPKNMFTAEANARLFCAAPYLWSISKGTIPIMESIVPILGVVDNQSGTDHAGSIKDAIETVRKVLAMVEGE